MEKVFSCVSKHRHDASLKLRKFPTKPVANYSNSFRGDEQGRPLIKFNKELCAIDPTGPDTKGPQFGSHSKELI